MQYLHKLSIVLLLFLFHNSLIAQAPVTEIGINIKGFRTEKKVIIRWMLYNAKQWRYAIKKGFNIERAEGNSNKFRKLNKTVVLPISKALLSKYDSTSFVFQAMGFLIAQPNSVAARGEDDNTLYNLNLLYASYETEAAVLSASAFVDTTIEKGKTYTYRVTVANTNITQTVGKTIIPSEIALMPKSPKLNAVFGDRIVSFNWNVKEVINDYFATILERSTDSIAFKRVGLPYVEMLDKGKSSDGSKIIETTDSIPNDIKFYYRLKGVNFFGLTSEPSNVVFGVGVPALNATSQIKSVNPSNKN